MEKYTVISLILPLFSDRFYIYRCTSVFIGLGIPYILLSIQFDFPFFLFFFFFSVPAPPLLSLSSPLFPFSHWLLRPSPPFPFSKDFPEWICMSWDSVTNRIIPKKLRSIVLQLPGNYAFRLVPAGVPPKSK